MCTSPNWEMVKLSWKLLFYFGMQNTITLDQPFGIKSLTMLEPPSLFKILTGHVKVLSKLFQGVGNPFKPIHGWPILCLRTEGQKQEHLLL